MPGKSLAALWYRPGQKAVMTSHTAPMAPATPFFLLSEYQTPTILSSKSFRLLFPGNQGHRSPHPRPPQDPQPPDPPRQNYQAIPTLVSHKAGTPARPRTPPPSLVPRPRRGRRPRRPAPVLSSPVPHNSPITPGKVSKGRAEALPLVVSRGSGGVFFQFGKNTSPAAAGPRPLAALPARRGREQKPPSILGTPRPVGRSPSCQPPRTML